MASAIPLNSFKTIITNITNVANTVYTAPAGVTTVVLLAQVSNIDGANTVNVTAAHRRGANTTRLIANAKVPIQDAAKYISWILEQPAEYHINEISIDPLQIQL